MAYMDPMGMGRRVPAAKKCVLLAILITWSCNTTPRKLPSGFHTRTQLPRLEVDVLVSVSWVLQKPLTAFCCLCPLLCRVSAWYTATSKMDYPYDHLFKHQRLLD